MRLWRRATGQNLLDQVLLIATTASDLDVGQHTLDEELDIGVVSTWSEDGRPVVPAFTSEKRLVDWQPEGGPWIGLSGRDLIALFLQGEWEAIVIDPPRTTREISRSDAERLLGVDRGDPI